MKKYDEITVKEIKAELEKAGIDKNVYEKMNKADLYGEYIKLFDVDNVDDTIDQETEDKRSPVVKKLKRPNRW